MYGRKSVDFYDFLKILGKACSAVAKPPKCEAKKRPLAEFVCAPLIQSLGISGY